MSPDTFDKIRLLAQKTRESFNFYATMDTTAPETAETMKNNSLAQYALYRELAQTLEIAPEIASLTNEGFLKMAEICDASGYKDLAEDLRLNARITIEVLEELDLPEGTCPTKEGTKAAAARVMARYPHL